MAYNTVVTQRPTEAGTLIAFSTGSLLSLALGKFSRFNETAVQWLAAVPVTVLLPCAQIRLTDPSPIW